MKVYVIRHSIRETPEEFSDFEDGDPDAKLTPEGEELASAMGERMAEMEEIPTVIYASPTVRAEQTAELIAKAIKNAGFAPPSVKTDVSIGPHQSVRGLLLQLGADDSAEKVAVVTHREAIVNGLKALAVDNDKDTKVDNVAMCEVRILKMKRKSGKWKEQKRLRPSDLTMGFPDTY